LTGTALRRIERQLLQTLSGGLARGLPALSLAVATRRGVWTRALGYADLVRRLPASEDQLFGIGSITKTFVAVVVHQLVDEGRLALDASPFDVLGSAVAGIANADRATLAQLLDHSSGIPNWEFVPAWIRRGRGADMDPARIWGKRDVLDYVHDLPPTGEPGAAFHYSNTNHTLLGLVIEEATGQDAAEAIRARVLRPLGLTGMVMEGFEPLDAGRLPARYHFATAAFCRDAGLHPDFRPVSDRLVDVSTSNLSVEWTAGGMLATARDLAMYGLALRDGRLSSTAGQARLCGFRRLAGTDREIGQGLFREPVGATRVVNHAGNTLGFGAGLAWPDGADPVIALLSNAGAMHAGNEACSPGELLRETDLIEQCRELAELLAPGR
jgi:D-alanyl-D-alanine carboxypeptidase